MNGVAFSSLVPLVLVLAVVGGVVLFLLLGRS